MTPRERVFRAVRFDAPDVVPLEYHPSPAGLYEHGQKLKALWTMHPQDFGDFAELPIETPDPRWIDETGRYRELRTDEWGVTWELLIFGIVGHPVQRPLDNWANLEGYRPPAPPATEGPDFEREHAAAREHQRRFFLKSGWASIFEVMHAVRRFEDVLMDIALDTPEINRLADLIADCQTARMEYLLKLGVDAIQFADDFGTQSALFFSPDVWRRFFKPRFERMVAPVKAAGKLAFYHTCGYVWHLLDDIAALGMDAIWPQIGLYDEGELAARCRQLGMSVALHPDRAKLMTNGTPREIREAVERLARVFQVERGGAWFYVEIDNGFPIENVRELIESIGRLRAV